VVVELSDQAAAIQIAVVDSLSAIQVALREVKGLGGRKELDAVNQITVIRNAGEGDVQAAADRAGVNLTPGVGASLLVAHMWQWLPHGRDYASLLGTPWTLVADDDAKADARIVEAAAMALQAVADVDTEPDPVEARAVRETASDHLLELASILEDTGLPQPAMGCAGSSLNFLLESASPRLIPALQQGIAYAVAAGDREKISSFRLREAQALELIGGASPAELRRRLDAFEGLIRHLPADGPARATTLRMIDWALRRDDALRGLIPLLLAQQGRVPDPGSAAAWLLVAGHRMEVASDDDAFPTEFMGFAMAFEDERLERTASTDIGAAETSWSTFAFTHPSLLDTIPLGDSILQERGLHQLFLVIAHEVTHVVTMLGHLAWGTMALQTALLELELRLWTFVIGSKPALGRRATALGVAPLTDPNILALAQAERALEVTLKLRALQAVWQPWLEGVALFGESSSKSTTEHEIMTAIHMVLANLIDVATGDVPELADRDALEKRYRRYLEDGERLHIESIRQHGRFRLADCIVQFPDRYLAGYVAVRAMVSAWRAKRPSIDGDAAFRLLVHATRHGTADAIPDLALPLDRFRATAHERMLDWLHQMGGASRHDLDRFCETEGASAIWKDGRYVEIDASVEDTGPRIEAYLERAQHSLLEEDADPDRVPTASDETKEILRAVASALAASERSWVVEERVLQRLAASVSILPIGGSDCSFWLSEATESVMVLLRTISVDAERRASKYVLLTLGLEADHFSQLRNEVLLRQESRMHVTRVADLVSIARPVEGRPQGTQYLIFHYGDWWHIIRRSFLGDRMPMEDSLRPAVIDRLRPEGLFAFESGLIADGRRGAVRTKAWIDAIGDRWDDLGYPIRSWVDRVNQLADDVLTSEGADDRANARRILNTVAGAEVAQRLGRDGLGGLAAADVALIDELARVLHASAHHPTDSVWLDEHATEVASLIGPVMKRTSWGWDVRAMNGG
jgi:hypothetical protein